MCPGREGGIKENYSTEDVEIERGYLKDAYGCRESNEFEMFNCLLCCCSWNMRKQG